MLLYIIIVAIHIACAAIIFGLPAGLVGSVKRAIPAGQPAIAVAAREAQRKGKITTIFAILTLLSGIALIFVRGGFGAVSANFHAALTVMLAAIIFSFAWMKPTGARLVELADTDPIDESALRSALKKLAMGSGILHAAWLCLLVLMYYRF